MEVEVREERDGVVVVTVSGDLNAAGCGRLERELADRVAAGRRHIVVDLGQVRYVSSAGLRVFLVVLKQIGTGGAFILARPLQTVTDVLDLSGFSQILRIEPSLEAGIAAAAPAGGRSA